MKLSIPPSTRRRAQSGIVAIVTVLTILGLMTIYLLGNGRTLANLRREIRLLEHEQKQRLEQAAPARPPAPSVPKPAQP